MLQKAEFASKAMRKPIVQERPDNSGCEMLNLEEVLASLERMPLPPSVEDFACVLLKCKKKKNLAYALRLHSYMCKSRMEAHGCLGNYLVPMLVEGGSICDAQNVFDRLADRNAYSWTSLISGYIECGETQHAFMLYQKMQDDSVHPMGSTFVALLKACVRLKDVGRGQDIHGEIIRKGLERDLYVGSTLVDMYAKCGSLAKARDVFDKLPLRDAVSWNALIAAYVQQGLGHQALNCFKQMQLEYISPSAVTYVCTLKACGSIGALDKGQEIHAEIGEKGLLEKDLVVGNALVDMYTKCDWLAKAREVFDKLLVRDVVSWNALITGYSKHGLGEEALDCLDQMQLEGFFPDVVTYVCSLKACGSIVAADKGQEIHAEITKRGLERDLLVGCTLVDMYAKWGSLAKARDLFDKLPCQNVVSWNALIAGYANYGLGKEALNCVQQMQLEGVSLDPITFVCSLKACGSIGAINKGEELHAEIVRKGMLEGDLVVGNALVDMYVKCGSPAKAQEVFDQLLVRDSLSWNSLIAGYVEHGPGQGALNCFGQMQLEGIPPDAVTFVYGLKACGSIGAIHKGQEIHAEIARRGLLERDIVVGGTLVDMYAKCGMLAKAQEVFDKLPVRDVVAWNALLTAYVNHALGQEALNCFEQMQLDNVSPSVVTFICSLKACGSIGDIEKGQDIHVEIARRGLLENDLTVGNALVDMYAKCGSLAKAREAFDMLPARDVVSWNALIAGYASQGIAEEALNCFDQMRMEGVSPDAVTFVSSLKTYGILGATGKAQEIHAEITRKGTFESNPLVGNAVIDMHAKCGFLAKAQEAFDKLPFRDEISWNALMAGYAYLGESENVFQILDRMRQGGINPNGITFLIILTVCSHTGLVDKGQMYFEAMSKDFGIVRTVEHHTCMVDLLGRAGQLDQAVAFMQKMPVHPNVVVWHTMLGACRKWGNVELGRQAFEHAVQSHDKDAGAYVLMSNIYADVDMQEDDEKKVEAMKVEEQAWESPGQNWTDDGQIAHSFLVGNTGHSQGKTIYATLEDCCVEVREEGYVPDSYLESGDMSVDATKDDFCGHSEKFDVSNRPKGIPIHVKNLLSSNLRELMMF